MIEFIILGILAACLTHFLNYTIGKPGSKEFSPYEIFSSYTFLLSKRRLKEVGLWQEYSDQYHENLKRIETKHASLSLNNDFKKMVYDAADPFFTYERMFGMCPVCTGFWITLASALIFTQNILNLLIVIVVSHVTIRILSKII